jgi:hypothetical protein
MAFFGKFALEEGMDLLSRQTTEGMNEQTITLIIDESPYF